MRRVLLLSNPTAGMGAGRISRQRLLDAARRELQRSLKVESATAPDSAGISALASQGVAENFDAILAAGGDGTINAVVNGMMRDFSVPDFHWEHAPHPATVSSSTHKTKKNLPNPWQPYSDEVARALPSLGVLPMGTGNVFAYNMGIRATLRDACRIIRRGETRRIDLGMAHSWRETRYFLLMAGIGFDAKVVEETSLRLKYVLRDFAYVLKTLQNVVEHQGFDARLHFSRDREYSEHAWMVMIGNAASYAWDIKVTSQAQMDDGTLDVCLMPFENKIVSIQHAMQILTGQHIERGTARYWKTPMVRIESEPPVPVQLDGDEWSQTPIDVGVLPGALRVLAPPEEES